MSTLDPIDQEIVEKALIKQRSYRARLFSTESFGEWLEYRTPLGRYVELFKEYCASPTPQLIARSRELRMQADYEAEALLNKLQIPLIPPCNSPFINKVNWHIENCCELQTYGMYTLPYKSCNFTNLKFLTDKSNPRIVIPDLMGVCIAASLAFLLYRTMKRKTPKDDPITVDLIVDAQLFLCSITKKMMSCPMILPDGNRADRSALAENIDLKCDTFLKELIKRGEISEGKVKISDVDYINFLCPIGLEQMGDPVLLPDGKRAERKSVQLYYDIGGRTCVETKEELSNPRNLPSDKIMKEILKQLRKFK